MYVFCQSPICIHVECQNSNCRLQIHNLTPRGNHITHAMGCQESSDELDIFDFYRNIDIDIEISISISIFDILTFGKLCRLKTLSLSALKYLEAQKLKKVVPI
jgi:hypothetical protein